MRRRSRASSKMAKGRSRKAKTLKVARHSSSSVASRETEFVRFRRERDEALEREIATAEVLKVISRSKFDLQVVFDTLVESATRVCKAYDSVIWLRQGDQLNVRAHFGPLPAPAGMASQPIGPGWVTGRAVVDRTPVHVHDLSAAVKEFPAGSEMANRLGHRTTLTIPLMREGEAIGAILIRRTEVKPFTDKQIELLQNFAAQAVIAIENTRLLNELRQRTTDLTESLEQQTATSDVLGVISSSPGELQAVFDIILKNANRLCDAKFSALFIYENGVIRVPSHVDLPPRLAEHLRKRNGQPPTPGTAIETLIRTKRLIHIPDQRGSPEGLSSPATTLAGARTYLAVPLLKDGNVIGAIAIYRQEVRPFTDKQVELVQNFASQAVIAIENARLLNELRQSLQQQTATAEVLKTISRSTFDLQTVLDTL